MKTWPSFVVLLLTWRAVRAMILDVPSNISSLALGGLKGTTLYIAGSGSSRLYRVELEPASP